VSRSEQDAGGNRSARGIVVAVRSGRTDDNGDKNPGLVLIYAKFEQFFLTRMLHCSPCKRRTPRKKHVAGSCSHGKKR
jgi:hypothetical protein